MGHHIQPARYHLRKGDIDTVFIAVDRNQCTGTHAPSNEANHIALASMGHTLIVANLPYGDYALMTPHMTDIMKRRGKKLRKLDFAGAIDRVIDRKGSIAELAQNLCSTREEHERFHTEYTLAQQCGAEFYILCEDDHIRCIDDVERWVNPRISQYYCRKAMEQKGFHFKHPLPSQPPVNGVRLAKTLRTIESKYNVHFVFCTPQEAPTYITRILSGEL